ncbi:MAG TPA: xanthine dehydrogenase family protein subunit M [Solirubrobacteraceae bacterium]
MNPFAIARAADPGDAQAAVARHPGARFLAGGTTLVDLLKLDVETPELVVDINHVGLDTVEPAGDGGVRIGALARMSAVARHELVARPYPVVSEALLAGASPQLRNMASIGGNLMQRSRCTYFRDTSWPCNKRDPGSGCAALHGHTRGHAVLGVSDQCIATHPADLPVALVALEATVHVRTPEGGERAVPVGDFHVAYGEDPARESVLEPGELITAVTLPPVDWYRRSHYVKARDRASYEFALAAAAVALDLDGDTIRDARVALGGVATKPWRSPEAEDVLRGATTSEAAFAAAAEAALAGARPRADNAYKVPLARKTIVRALKEVAER